MNTTSDSLYRSESMPVNDNSTNIITPDTSAQTFKNLNESKISGNGSDSILKDDSKSMNSVDSKSSKSPTKKKELAEKETKATEDNSISEFNLSKRSESTFDIYKSKKKEDTSGTENTKDDKKKKKDKKEKKDRKDGKDDDKDDKKKCHKDDKKDSKKSKKETKDSKDKKESKEKKDKKNKKDKKEKKEEEEETKIAKQHSDKEEERKWDLDELAKSFRNAYPLWTKITEKWRFKDFVIREFEEDLKIKSHSRDNTSDMYKIYYYTIADWEPIYIRNKSEVELNMKNTYKDDRDKWNILFDLLIENIQEAFTSDKAKRTYDNSFLEFLGDGVLSIFLAWDLIIKYPMPKDVDIDSLRINKSSSKKFFEIMTNDDFRLYEFIGIPVHKTLEFFIPPVIKSSYYLAAKFFDRNPAFYTKLETVKWNNIEIVKEEQKETFEENQDDEGDQEM